MGAMPEGLTVNVHLWDEGDGIENTLRQHRAVFHPVLHSLSLDRLRKRHIIDDDDEGDGDKLDTSVIYVRHND